MKNWRLVVALFVLVAGISSCKKYNQIDNGSTVKTPYTLFIGGYNGVAKKTNDALYFSSLFYTDNSKVRQFVVADSVICYIKDRFYYSEDDGKYFKLSSMAGSGWVLPQVDSFYKSSYPHIALYDAPNKTIYLCAKNGVIQKSTDLGKTFTNDNNWFAGVTPINARSITQTDNGKLFSMGIDSFIYRKDWDGTALSWNQVSIDTPYQLPSSKNWYISSSHDTLFALDFNGKVGVYFSTDEGKKWYAGKQLPTGQEILFGEEVFGQFFVGLDSAGLYTFSGNQFKAVGKGIPWYARVSHVVGKTIRYRTDRTRNYWFCATDQGLYMSETDGTDWHLVHAGPYSCLR